jgi:hypothetical protein
VCVLILFYALVEEDETDETKRRLGLKQLLKDHLVIVQLFNLTEVTFGLALLCYYTVMVLRYLSFPK